MLGQRLVLGVGTDERIHQPTVKTLGLGRGIELDRVLLHARRAEVVAIAADGDDERVVGKRSLGRHLPAFLVVERRHVDLAADAVEAHHFAHAIAEVMPVRLREIVELVYAQVHAARRDLVQQRLPQVGAGLVDERDLSLAALAELVAEAGGEFQPACATADDDDTIRPGV